MTMTAPHDFVVWREGEWFCELHHWLAGESRLEVYKGDQLVSAESISAGPTALLRAEILRQRVLRGNLRAT